MGGDHVRLKRPARAVLRIALMLNPAGAVIQALLTTYEAVMFFRERATQNLQVVESLFDSLGRIASGDVSGAAAYVEATMARTVPVVISFLARLIGLNGVTERVRDILRRIREPVDRAIDRAVDWVAAQGRRLAGVLAPGAKRILEAARRRWRQITGIGAEQRFSSRKERHRLWVERRGRAAVVMVASEATALRSLLESGLVRNLSRARQELEVHRGQALELLTRMTPDMARVAEMIESARARPPANAEAAQGAESANEHVHSAERTLVTHLRPIFEALDASHENAQDDPEIGRVVNFSGGHEPHRLWVDVRGGTPHVMVASNDPMPVVRRLLVIEQNLTERRSESAAPIIADPVQRGLAIELLARARSLAREADQDAERMVQQSRRSAGRARGRPPADEGFVRREETLASVLSQLYDILGLRPSNAVVAELILCADTEGVDRTWTALDEFLSDHPRIGHGWVRFRYFDRSLVPPSMRQPTRGLLTRGERYADMGFWPLVYVPSAFNEASARQRDREEPRPRGAGTRLAGYRMVQQRLRRGQTPPNVVSDQGGAVGFSAQPWKWVPGRVTEPDTEHEPNGAVKYRITQPQVDAMIAYANGKRSSRYNVYFYNCTHFAVESARAAGQSPPSGELWGSIALPSRLYYQILRLKNEGDPRADTTPLGEVENVEGDVVPERETGRWNR